MAKKAAQLTTAGRGLSRGGTAMPPALDPALLPGSSFGPVSVGVNLSVTNWQPSKPLACLSKLHCDLDKPEPRLGGAFEVAASRSRHLATLNGCKQVAYTVILKDEWTQAEAFAPPPGSGSCAFAFVHEESKFVTLRSEGDQHPQQGRDERKEETVSQPSIPKEVTLQKAAAQATDTAQTATPPAIRPWEDAWCLNGILAPKKHACCSTSCGRCGGDECEFLPGGPYECCPALLEYTCNTPEDAACRVPPPEEVPYLVQSALPPSPPASVNLYKTHTGMDTWYKDRPARSTDCEWLCRDDPRCVDYRFDVVHSSCALFDSKAIMSLSLLAEPTKQTKPGSQAPPQRLLQQEQKQADGWTLIEVPRDDLPWPVDNYRRNSRVPKILPHLFFPPTVDATVYIDAENSVSASLQVVVQSMLSSCDASFAAQTSPSRAVSVMKEFEVIRFSKNANEPEACHKQERAYRADKAYMATVNEGRAVGINAELLVRRNLWPYNLLGNAWMRAYLRGGDRDQPAFSYAFEQSVMKPCRKRFEEESGAHKTGYSKGQCGLACGTGFVNLVGSARSADCLGDSVKTYCENQPEGFCEVKPRPWWATQPPSWVCSSKL